MKTRKTLTKLTITMALIALATAGVFFGAGWPQPVAAQTGDGSVKFISYASVGIIPGEKIRLSVANTKQSTGTLTLSFQYYLAHMSNSSSSIPLYESDLIPVPPREIRSADVAREDLKTEGEPGTGRAQVIVKMTIIAPAGVDQDDFPASLEVISDGNGAVPPDSKYRLIILAAKRSKQINAPISFLPGERLSFTCLNPKEEGSEPVSVTTYAYDQTGRLVSQSEPAKLEPGEAHTFRFNRDDIPVPGEKLTGRLQVRTVVKVASIDGSVHPVKVFGWVELVNNRTGSTSGGGNYFTGTVTVSGDGFE